MRNKKNRFERKWIYKSGNYLALINSLIRSNFFFNTQHPTRRVNSIYFDNSNYSSIRQNLDGASNKKKIRVRWYGEIFNAEIQPQIENKSRINQHNYKITKKLKRFRSKSSFDLISFKKYIHDEKNSKDEINFYLNNLYPSLLVSYRRKYFVFDNIRITLDTGLKFINLAKVNIFSKKNFLCINKKQIIELKYSDKFHFQAGKITKMFNNRLDKFSKYQIGLLETFYR